MNLKIAIVILAVAAPNFAGAAPPALTPEYCQVMANLAEASANARDHEISLKRLERESRLTVQDPERLRLILDVTRMAYYSPDKTPAQLGRQERNRCRSYLP